MDGDGAHGKNDNITGKDTRDGNTQPARQTFKEKIPGKEGSTEAWKRHDMIKEKLI